MNVLLILLVSFAAASSGKLAGGGSGERLQRIDLLLVSFLSLFFTLTLSLSHSCSRTASEDELPLGELLLDPLPPTTEGLPMGEMLLDPLPPTTEESLLPDAPPRGSSTAGAGQVREGGSLFESQEVVDAAAAPRGSSSHTNNSALAGALFGSVALVAILQAAYFSRRHRQLSRAERLAAMVEPERSESNAHIVLLDAEVPAITRIPISSPTPSSSASCSSLPPPPPYPHPAAADAKKRSTLV